MKLEMPETKPNTELLTTLFCAMEQIKKGKAYASHLDINGVYAFKGTLFPTSHRLSEVAVVRRESNNNTYS